MLSSINPTPTRECSVSNNRDERWDRDEKEDFKIAIDYLYEFKLKLSKLHPHVLDRIESLLQRPRF